MNIAKDLIKYLLRKSGKKIIPYDIYEDKLNQVRYLWLTSININTIFDIGASEGQFCRRIRKIFPDVRIYSFEALQQSYQQLITDFPENNLHKSFNVVLGNTDGETDFYQCNEVGSSSMLIMDELHKTAFPTTTENKLIRLKCERLDDFILKNNLTFEKEIMIKLDVQGAEKIVLEGAPKLLEKASVVYSEVNFNSLYKGDVLFNDLSDYLYKKEFRIKGIENITQSLVDGRFLQADVIFVKM